MRSAAKLHAHLAHFNNAHGRAVFFIKHSRSAGFKSVFQRADFRLHGQIFANHVIGNRFHSLEFFISDFGKVGKIKTQVLRIHKRTGLFNVIAEHRLERRLQDVRTGMVGGNGFSSFLIDDQTDLCTYFYFSRSNDAFMDNEFIDRFFRVFHGKVDTGAFQISCVACLSAGFAIKRCGIQNNLRLLPNAGDFRRLAVNKNGRNFCLVFGYAFITAKLACDSRA